MTILTHGKYYGVKFICDCCGCEFKANENDASFSEELERSFDPGLEYNTSTVYYCDCPECNNRCRAKEDGER